MRERTAGHPETRPTSAGPGVVEPLWQDVRFAVRSLRRRVVCQFSQTHHNSAKHTQTQLWRNSLIHKT